MLRFIAKKLAYGLLVLVGVVVLVFFLFQGFGDPARLVMGQGEMPAPNRISAKNCTSISPNGNSFCFISMMYRRFVSILKKRSVIKD